MATNKIQSGLRLKEATHGKLQTIAINEGRSLNNLIEYVLQKYLDEYERKNGEIKPHIPEE